MKSPFLSVLFLCCLFVLTTTACGDNTETTAPISPELEESTSFDFNEESDASTTLSVTEYPTEPEYSDDTAVFEDEPVYDNSSTPFPTELESTEAAPFEAPTSAPAVASDSVYTVTLSPADGNPRLADRVLGNPDAPVTLYEYASFTCIHCATLHSNIIPTLKKEFVATGKVKFVYRDFPLDGLALKASQTSRCVSPDMFYQFVGLLFENREQWINVDGKTDGLQSLAATAGLDSAAFTECLADDDLLNYIASTRLEAANTYGIQSTPSLVINDKKFEGALSLDTVREALNKAIAAAP